MRLERSNDADQKYNGITNFAGTSRAYKVRYFKFLAFKIKADGSVVVVIKRVILYYKRASSKDPSHFKTSILKNETKPTGY